MARRKKSDSGLITSILYIVVGVLLAAFRASALDLAMTIVGIVFIISGVLELLKKNYVGGAISLIIGIVILVLGWTIASIVLLVLGILIAVKGLISLVEALKRKKKKLMQVLFPILTIVIGILIAFAFGQLADIILLIGGILLAVDGIIGLVAALKR